MIKPVSENSGNPTNIIHYNQSPLIHIFLFHEEFWIICKAIMLRLVLD